MTTAIQALTVLLPVCYLTAAALYAMGFAGEGAPRPVRARRIALGLALGVHVALFALRGLDAHRFPVIETWTGISSVALGLALLYAWVSRGRDDAATGGIVLGVVFAMQLAASAFGPPRTAERSLSPFFVIHAATSIAACSALVLSGIHGGLYLVLFRHMRRHRFGLLFRGLPDLSELAQLTRRSALAGFALLTVGVNVGIWWAHSEGLRGFEYSDPYVLLVLMLWLHFGLVAFSRRIPGLSARRTSYAAALGMMVLVLAFFLTLLPRATFHWQS